MNDTVKFSKMRAFLSKPIAPMLAALDEEGPKLTGWTPPVGGNIPILAALSLAASWVTQLDTDADGNWAIFRLRLQRAIAALNQSPDAGQPSHFGLWDGLAAVSREADRIDASTSADAGEASDAG